VTFITLLVTLFVTLFLPWRRQPRFAIEFENKEPYCRPLEQVTILVNKHDDITGKETLVQEKVPWTSYWLRLKVTNRGRSVAKICSGRLVKFMGKSGPIETHDLVKLHWINTPWSAQEYFPPIDLNRGEHDFLDILVTRLEHDRKALLFMSPENLFSNNPDKVPDGTCAIQVTVYGDNVDPCTKEYSIDWDGDNYDDIRLHEVK
jgi:hypothetical protein